MSDTNTTTDPALARHGRKRRTGVAARAVAAGLIVIPLAAVRPASATTLNTADFVFAAGYQTWTVPDGVHSVTMDVIGGAGADGNNASSCGSSSSGAASEVKADVPVTPGQTLSMWVGGGGHLSGPGGTGTPDGLFAGGHGGGAGFGASGGGGGGGAVSVVWTGTGHNDDDILVVGGGGGGGGGKGGIDAQCGGRGGFGGNPAGDGLTARASLGEGGAGGSADQFDSQLHHSGLPGRTPPAPGGVAEIGGGGGGGGAGIDRCSRDSTGVNDCYGIGGGGGNGGDDAAGNGGGGGAGGTSYLTSTATSPFYSFAGEHGDNGQITLTWRTPSTTTLSAGAATAGQPVTLHALVDPSDGGGTVAFAGDGSAIPGCGAVSFTSGGGTTWQANCVTSDLTAGTHQITATYSGDDSYAGSSDHISLTVAAPVTAPGAPTGVTAVAGNAQATVSFTAPAGDGGSPVTSYKVTATDHTDAARGGQTATGSASPIGVTGLTNGDSYTFTVTATNSAGTGPASAPSNAVTPSAPGAPSADLAVTVHGPAAAGDGSTFTETITVHNAGPGTATGIATGLNVPWGLTVTSAPEGSRIGPVVYWWDSSLAANATVTHTLTFRVDTWPHYTAAIGVATASSKVADPHPADNVALTTVKLG